MSRRVHLVLLCEDAQHEAFARRFLRRQGWNMRALRVEKAPQGRGAGEQFVRARFPLELREQRRRPVAQALIVLIDGDTAGVSGRLAELDARCAAKGVKAPRTDEPVAVFVPTRSIETWFAYLEGQTVDEQRTYPRLARERDCGPHVDRLAGMCARGALRQPAPSSLLAACEAYRRLRSVSQAK